MAYQPNPNPFERGIELPAGCKDLYEALEKAGEVKPEGETVREGAEAEIHPIERGSVNDVPKYQCERI